MKSRPRTDRAESFSLESSRRMHIALLLLGRAHRTARIAGRDLWAHAVTGLTLRNVGLTEPDLAWLLDCGYVDLRLPNGSRPARIRSRRPPLRHLLSDQAEYVATSRGAEFAIEFLQTLERHLDTDALPPLQSTHAPSPPRPHWNRQTRELRLGETLIKQFSKSAPNQELILATFEELGWPHRIDDPLPPKHNLVPAVRLHDTINNLNRSLHQPLLQFHADGTGHGVRWHTTASPPHTLFSEKFPINTNQH